MLRIAFASTNQEQVDLHFGAAERLVVYDVAPGQAELVGVGEFIKVDMKGTNKDKGLPRELQGVVHLPTAFNAPYAPSPEEVGPPSDKPPEDKVIAKLDFLQGCSAVYAASIGASSIKRLMALNIQPIIVDNGHDIVDLLNEVSLALHCGGLAWVDRAVSRLNKSPDRFTVMAEEGWQEEDLPSMPAGAVPGRPGVYRLITSIDDIA
jgi:nitrogen fixation protein NifX